MTVIIILSEHAVFVVGVPGPSLKPNHHGSSPSLATLGRKAGKICAGLSPWRSLFMFSVKAKVKGELF